MDTLVIIIILLLLLGGGGGLYWGMGAGWGIGPIGRFSANRAPCSFGRYKILGLLRVKPDRPRTVPATSLQPWDGAYSAPSLGKSPTTGVIPGLRVLNPSRESSSVHQRV